LILSSILLFFLKKKTLIYFNSPFYWNKQF
jgi:hypothetical protein